MKPGACMHISAALVAAAILCHAGAARANDQAPPVRFERDAQGNALRMVDGRGVATVQQYDRYNRPVRKILPAALPGTEPGVLAMGYDHLGRLQRVQDPRGLATSFTTDGLGNLLHVDSPDSGETRMEYSMAGHLRQLRDARGQAASYEHDAIGRVTRTALPGQATALMEYDAGGGGATGRLTRMTDESGETRYRYDPAGRLLEQVQAHGTGAGQVRLRVAYSYGTQGGALGKLESIAYPSGNRVVFGYGANGRVSSLTLHRPAPRQPEALLGDIAYEPFGPPRAWQWPGRDRTAHPVYARERNLDGRVVSYTLGDKRNKGAVRFVSYDAAGRIVGFRHVAEWLQGGFADQSFSYDDLGQLTGFVSPAGVQAFAYDASGNRKRVVIGQDEYRYDVDSGSNRVVSRRGGIERVRNFRYDAAGNLEGDGTRAFTYGAGGRLAAVLQGARKVAYRYNGLGQRTVKEGDPALVPGGRRYFVYDPAGRMLGEYSARGEVVEETVFLGDIPVVVLAHPAARADDNALKVHYVYSDHLDTARVIEQGDSGRIVWRWDHADPFGIAGPQDGSEGRLRDLYNRRFPAQYHDKESHLYFTARRSYDPAAGRFVQPARGGDAWTSSYAYAGNDPLLRVGGDGTASDAPGAGQAAWREWIALPVAWPAPTSYPGYARSSPGP